MNALTLIGAAVVCKGFAELLSKDPARAARALGVVLTNVELHELKEIFEGKKGEKARESLKGINIYFCKKQPCALAPANLGEELCNDSAAA